MSMFWKNTPGVCVITLVETPDGTLAVQHKFDPPMAEAAIEDSFLANAAAVAIGAIGDFAKAVEQMNDNPDEPEDTDDTDDD